MTIATERAPGMTMRLVPLFVWMTLVASVMIVFALPALAAALVMLLSDRLLDCAFLRSRRKAARRFCGSITSGSSGTRKSISSCSPRSA